MTPSIAAILLCALSAGVGGQETRSALDWERAANEIRRLAPGAFPELPAAVVRELNARQCTIPQAEEHAEPHNVIRGSFTRKERVDWRGENHTAGRQHLLSTMAPAGSGRMRVH
jgi:hypothetical protein